MTRPNYRFVRMTAVAVCAFVLALAGCGGKRSEEEPVPSCGDRSTYLIRRNQRTNTIVDCDYLGRGLSYRLQAFQHRLGSRATSRYNLREFSQTKLARQRQESA